MSMNIARMLQVRGGGCAACKPGAQAEPFVQGLESPSLGIGSRVRVKQSVSAPAYGWGRVKHGMVGVVTRIDSDGDLKVDFAGTATGWNCKSSEMEVMHSKADAKDPQETPKIRAKPKEGGHTGMIRSSLAPADQF